MNMRHARLILFFALTWWLVATPVSAHANLVRSEPPASSAQRVSPPQVFLWFSEDIEANFSSVSVLDSTGTAVDKGDSHRLPTDVKALAVSLPPLPVGLYTVVWQTLSAVDGHTSNGSFVFAVGDKAPPETSPRELMTLVDSALSASAPPPLGEVMARWLNLLSLTLLVGCFAFPYLILWHTVRNTATRKTPPLDATVRERWARRWRRVTLISLGLYGVATLFVLMAQAERVGGFTLIGQVLFGTRFGMVWWARVAGLIALGLVLANMRARWAHVETWTIRRTNLQAAYPLLSISTLNLGLLLMQSLNSHGAAVSELTWLALSMDFIHTTATAIWLGSLAQLLLTLPVFIQALQPAQRLPMLANVIARFSLVAFIAVGVLMVSGLYALWIQVGSFEAFFATLYGQTLLIKFLAVGPLLALGGFNLIVNRPALARALAQQTARLTHRLNLAVALEIVCGVVVLLTVGVLTSVAPAHDVYDPVPKLWWQTRTVADLRLTLGVRPTIVGANDFDLKVQAQTGRAISDASLVRLFGSMRDMEMGVQEVTMPPQGNGHYVWRGELLSMVGFWQVEALVRREGRDDARTTFELLARDLSASPYPQPQFPAFQQTETWLGLGLMALGFALGTASALMVRWSRARRVSGLGAALGVSVLGCLLVVQVAASVNAAPISIIGPYVPTEATRVRSPILVNDENLLAGRTIFSQHCVVCHGPQGKGNGVLAATLNPRPVDLTIHARLHPEGALFWWVTNGVKGTAMPSFETQLSETQRWQVVQFIRTLGLPPAPPKP
jgi:copper transport protein